MKNTIKNLGIIALAVAIGLSMVTCDNAGLGGGSSYIVNYNANGASGTVPAAQNVSAGTSIVVAAPGNLEYSGRIFGGWNTIANGSGTPHAAGSSMTVNSNTTLYAQWVDDSGITYTVTYDANGASGSAPPAQTVSAGVSIVVANQGGLTYAGRTFNGWNASASGSGISYTAGSSITVNTDITLYAQWTDGSGNSGGSNSNNWLFVSEKTYTVTDGFVGDIASETERTWHSYSYVNDRNFTEGYSLYNGGYRYRNSRNGNTGISASITGTTRRTDSTVYDGESGLALSSVVEQSASDSGFAIETINAPYVLIDTDSDGTRTYRATTEYESGGVVYLTQVQQVKIKNGITLETKSFTNDALSLTQTFAYPDSDVIRTKLPTFTLYNATYENNPANNTSRSVEVVSDSETELTLRVMTHNAEGILTQQYESTYKPASAIAMHGGDNDFLVPGSLPLGYRWSRADGEITITQYDGPGGDITIPEIIDGSPVVSIGAAPYASSGQQSFRNRQLTSVIIPDSVVSIGNSAFADNQLASVTNGSNVASIGNYAFENNLLESVEIPDSVVSIGNSAFANNQLESVDIPYGVTFIGGGAFMDNQLISVDIPYSVESIGASAFANNAGPAEITIPSGVTSIGNNVFSGWTNLTHIEFPFTGQSNQTLISMFGTSASSVPETLKTVVINGGESIPANAFRNLQLESVVLPDSVTSIGNNAFEGCQLTSIDIPGSVVSIGSSAFRGNQLESVDIPYGNVQINDSAFRDNQLTSVSIPDSVILIAHNAFANNQLYSVSIPDSVTGIYPSAFIDNPLTSVTIGAGVNPTTNAFPGAFDSYYIYVHSRAAGTYTRPDTSSNTWTRQP